MCAAGQLKVKCQGKESRQTREPRWNQTRRDRLSRIRIGEVGGWESCVTWREVRNMCESEGREGGAT